MDDALDLSALAGRIAAGDPAAETELVTRFAPRVRVMALVRTRDIDIARDLTQETLLAVLKALRKGQIREAERVEAFVAGVARNIINNHKRRTRRRAEVPLDDQGDVVAVSSNGVHEEAERRRLLAAALTELSTADRQVLLLTLVDGLKSGEIARKLGVSPDVARTRKSRALKRILDVLGIRSRNAPDGHI
jgi:RNA polymerase sigma factor (sigma-70 family)